MINFRKSNVRKKKTIILQCKPSCHKKTKPYSAESNYVLPSEFYNYTSCYIIFNIINFTRYEQKNNHTSQQIPSTYYVYWHRNSQKHTFHYEISEYSNKTKLIQHWRNKTPNKIYVNTLTRYNCSSSFMFCSYIFVHFSITKRKKM